MESAFAYDATTTYNSEISISDIQNTCIEVLDNQGMISYLIIYTETGRTFTLEAGPFVPDINELPDNTSIVFSQYDASEYKSKKQISKFLQPKDKGKRKAVEVREIDSSDAVKVIKEATDVNLILFMGTFIAPHIEEDDEEEGGEIC